MSTDVLEAELQALFAAAPGMELGADGLWRVTWPLPPITPAAAETATPESADMQEEAEEQLRTVLARLGVEPDAAEVLTSASLACATVAGQSGPEAGLEHAEAPRVLTRGSDLLGAIESLTAVGGHLESVVLSAARQLTVVHGRLLLADKGASGPEELDASQQQAWRSRAKSLTRAEIEDATGFGYGETRDLVAIANSSAEVIGPVHASLRSGESSWRLVRSYYRACAGMDHHDGAVIANGLFGTDPAASVTERLDSKGEFIGGPWRHKEFHRALDREIARINATDPEKKKQADAAAKASADTHLMLDENGTGTFLIGCTPLVGTAISERIDAAARRARAGGDSRNLRELRCAVATALLLNGVVDLSHIPDDPDHVTVEQSEQLARVLACLPPATLDVIVPLTALLGTDAEGNPIPAAFAAHPSNTAGAGGPGCTCTCTCGANASTSGPAQPAGAGLRGQPCPKPGRRTPESEDDPDDPDVDPDGLVDEEVRLPDVGVGEVIGANSLFLSPSQVRELALVPGSTLHRLLTDPASGRCLERSTTAYRFDKSMRDQIIAADRFCRAPGCLKPAKTSQLDHVQEYGTPDGHTCEANGMAASTACHDRKTKKDVDAIINANRDVTWTTLLGRIYTTKAHDYTQYTKLLTAAREQIDQDIASGASHADAIDTAIYQALSYRPPGAPFQASEDEPGFEDDFTGWDQITLTHTGSDGQRVYRPHPDTARAEHDRHTATRSTHGADADDRGEQRDDRDRDDRERGGQHEDREHGPWAEPHDDPPPF